MRNDSLKAALTQACEEAAALIAAVPYEGNVRIESAYEIKSEGGIEHRYVPRVDWLRAFLIQEKQIQSRESYRKAVIAFEADSRVSTHLNQLVGTNDAKSRVDTESTIRSLILQALDNETGRFSAQKFEDSYAALEQFFYSDTIKFRSLAPLYGFTMSLDRLELQDAAIIRIPKEEREEILAGDAFFGGNNAFFGFGVPEFGLECRIDVRKVIGDSGGGDTPGPMTIARDRFDDIQSTLRLFKEGDVGFDQIRIEGGAWVFRGRLVSIGAGLPQPMSGKSYSVSEQDASRLSDFYRLYRDAANRTQPGVAMAIRRLNFGYERRRPEDKLVDYCIAFEALLLQEKAELEHRLALRVAKLLGQDPNAREDLYLRIRAAYGTRSEIVHGEPAKEDVKVGVSRMPFGEFILVVEGLLRSSIRKVLTDYSTMTEKQMLKMLDRLIARGE